MTEFRAKPLLHDTMVMLGAYAIARMALLAWSLNSSFAPEVFASILVMRYLPMALIFAVAVVPMFLVLQSQRRWAWALALGVLRSVEFMALTGGFADLRFNAETALWYGSEIGASVLGALLGWLAFEVWARGGRLRRTASA